MNLLALQTAMPPWFVLPLAVGTIWIMSRHVMLLQRDTTMPPSRRRIRTANGVLMILITALLTYALGVMNSGPTRSQSLTDVRTFVMVWGIIIGFLPMVIGLGLLDAANTMRLHMAARRGMRDQLSAKLARDLVVMARQRRASVAGARREDAAGNAGIMNDGTGGD